MLFPSGRCIFFKETISGFAPEPANPHGQTSKDMTKEEMHEVA